MIWTRFFPHIPRTARYTVGTRIENNFLDLLELSYTVYFSEKEKKVKKILECISILDTTKFLVYIAWEAKFISHKNYEELGLNLEEVGRMFGGWRKNIDSTKKKNRT